MTTELDWPAAPRGTGSPADRLAPSPSHPTVIQQVREHIATAKAAGRPAPGRPTLVRLTGATDHQVRRALAVLAQDDEDLTTSTIQDDSDPPAPRPDTTSATIVDYATTSPTALTRPPQSATGGDGGDARVAARPPRPWPLLIIGLGAAVAVWSG